MYICILCTHIIWVPTNSPRPSPLGGSSSLVVPRIVTVKGGAWADMLLGLDLLRKEPGWAGAFERCPWVWRWWCFCFKRSERFHRKKLWESKFVSSFESDGQRWANEVLNHRIFGVFQGVHYVFTRSSGTLGNFFGTPGPRVGCPWFGRWTLLADTAAAREVTGQVRAAASAGTYGHGVWCWGVWGLRLSGGFWNGRNNAGKKQNRMV